MLKTGILPKPGIIHIGLITLAVFGLIAVTSVAISAGKDSHRPSNLNLITKVRADLCKKHPTFSYLCDNLAQYEGQSAVYSKSPPCGVYGDVNWVRSPIGNIRKVNKDDVQRIIKHIEGSKELRPEGKTHADVNGDGQINNQDVNLVLDYLEGRITTFPVCAAGGGTVLDRGPCYPVGDVNNDGAITDNDAQDILKYVAGIPPAGFKEDRAHIKGKNTITSIDAQLLRQYLARSIRTWPGCD